LIQFAAEKTSQTIIAALLKHRTETAEELIYIHVSTSYL
jgi:hypothetical protein